MMIITIELLDVLSFGSSGSMGVATSVRHGPGWPMGPRAGLGYGLGRASNLGISTGSGRARAESSIQITILFYTIKLIIHDKSSFLNPHP